MPLSPSRPRNSLRLPQVGNQSSGQQTGIPPLGTPSIGRTGHWAQRWGNRTGPEFKGSGTSGPSHTGHKPGLQRREKTGNDARLEHGRNIPGDSPESQGRTETRDRGPRTGPQRPSGARYPSPGDRDRDRDPSPGPGTREPRTPTPRSTGDAETTVNRGSTETRTPDIEAETETPWPLNQDLSLRAQAQNGDPNRAPGTRPTRSRSEARDSETRAERRADSHSTQSVRPVGPSQAGPRPPEPSRGQQVHSQNPGQSVQPCGQSRPRQASPAPGRRAQASAQP